MATKMHHDQKVATGQTQLRKISIACNQLIPEMKQVM